MHKVNFTLNGKPVSASYEPGMTFLEVLREECGITSAKNGCAPEGACGCCTVLFDGRPALSCLRKPEQMEGHAVETLEGMPEDMRKALGDAFILEGGVQCGFCIPGILVRASHAGAARQDGRSRSGGAGADGPHLPLHRLRANHRWNPDRRRSLEERRQTAARQNRGGTTISARNTGYREIRSLRKRTAQEWRGRIRPRDTRASIRRWEKNLSSTTCSSRACLHAAPVLSAHPRAKILAIDTAAAEAMPGVVRVLTAKDVPGPRGTGLTIPDLPVFVAVGETTCCVGDMFALVVADTMFHARKAAEKVEVKYEVLPPVTDPFEALEPGAPQVHAPGNYTWRRTFWKRRRSRAAMWMRRWQESTHIIEQTFQTQAVEPAFLEPEACLALPQGKGVKVYSQSQGSTFDQREIARVLNIPQDEVEIELASSGGSFGAKEELSIQVQTALAAFLLKRPVKTVLTRKESTQLHPKRHPMTLKYTVGADAEGHLLAVQVRIVGDTGGYAGTGGKCLLRAACHSCGPYRVPNVDVEVEGRLHQQSHQRGHARIRQQPGAIRDGRDHGHSRRAGGRRWLRHSRAQCSGPGRSVRHRPDHARERGHSRKRSKR